MPPGVLVVGSVNMDLVASTPAFPRPGETVFGKQFGMFPGGKGANQAVCCAKLGGQVEFIGQLGEDLFRDKLVDTMTLAGVGLQHLLIHPSASTGIALIIVEEGGENEIVVISGSNMQLTPCDLVAKKKAFENVSVLLLQLEIPLATVEKAAELAKNSRATVILNPAPAVQLPEALLSKTDFLTPNETEAEILSGVAVKDDESAKTAGRALLDHGVRNVVITLGERGCLWVHENGAEFSPAETVQAVDTTAAGDAFNGALAFSLAAGKSIPEAMAFANRVAAYSVTQMGAQNSMPTIADLRSA